MVTVERFVEPEEIQKSPENTRIPSHRVSGIADVEWGALPSYVEGYYGRDDDHFFAYDKEARSEEGLADYLKRYVHDCADHAAYLDLVGEELLAKLKAQASARRIA